MRQSFLLLPRGYGRVLVTASRPHFFAFPVGAALAGAHSLQGDRPDAVTLALVCSVAGIGWGVGQLLNDLFDEEADRMDAPHRPGPRGLLPRGPTLSVAVLLGLGLVFAVSRLHPWGLGLGGIAALLIATYNQAKRVPFLGNVSHGLVMATATVIGAAATHPHASILEVREGVIGMAAATGSWSALYLQANYEKDLRGDAAAGYCTLAQVLGIRVSALLRATAASGLLFCASGLVQHSLGQWGIRAAVFFVGLSALSVARANTQEAALKSYRWAVHGGILGMLSLGADALSPGAFVVIAVAAAVLTEKAFARSENP